MKNISFKTDVLPMKDKLFRLAFRITLNQQDAEDVVQETLIKIWNRRDHWDEIESLEGWAMTIARNMARDVIRKQDSHRTVS
ncbi:MAG: RNA polymerase sigma factor, partial [Prevotellaceae bacterium]|nr:RNA polymerase sigma factor [Prevotellaceae bacterium]